MNNSIDESIKSHELTEISTHPTQKHTKTLYLRYTQLFKHVRGLGDVVVRASDISAFCCSTRRLEQHSR
ncbi:hypothetical protein HMPREF1574_00813 [Gardnerella pickettii JCP7659]|nr:hypothetical protein HMPREF1574_00813 [Gardnerella pickettii JCP7659]